MISFMFKALMVLTFGVISNKYVKLWYASCFFLFFFLLWIHDAPVC